MQIALQTIDVGNINLVFGAHHAEDGTEEKGTGYLQVTVPPEGGAESGDPPISATVYFDADGMAGEARKAETEAPPPVEPPVDPPPPSEPETAAAAAEEDHRAPKKKR